MAPAPPPPPPPATRPLVRPPVTVGWRRAALLCAGALLLLAVYAAVRVTGGAPNPLVHFAYFAIALAALGAGWRGGLTSGAAAGLLLGPLMPDSTAASASVLGQWGWAIRLAAYLGAGGVVGWASDRTQELARESADRAAAARETDVLRASEERLRETLEAAADGILVFDADGRLTFANAAAEQLLGLAQVELLGATAQEITARVGALPRPDAPHARGQLMAPPEAGAPPLSREIALHHHDGTHHVLQVSVGRLRAQGSGAGHVITLREVTAERAVARERAAELASLEEVAQAAMGAPSATAAAEVLLAQFARVWPVAAAAIYLFDEGGAQRLATLWPFQAGQPPAPLVPAEMATQLRTLTAAGPARTQLERLPGGGAATLAAHGARSLLVLPLVADGTLVGALLAGAREAPEPLSGDEAAHLRTIGGLAAGIVQRALSNEESARLHLHERVSAVLANPGLLVAHFQPILSITERSVAGYEALARFHLEPVQPPDVWFAQAAQVGLGAELQALALSQARKAARLAVLPAGTFLSLNVSPRYLADPRVAAAFGDGPLERIVIEVTEEEAVADYAALRDAMAPYLARGARIAVDDAGAGYASMRHVTELRPAFVKLDAQLIRGLRDDTGHQALVQALVSFTAAIGAIAIAEGVEDPADLAVLARARVPVLAQGYAIARPGPAWPAVIPAALAACRARPQRRALPHPAAARTNSQ